MWDAVLGELQLQVPKPSYETWLRGTTGVSVSDGALVVRTPNAFVSEMLDTRMYSLISRCLEGITGKPLEIRFEVGGEAKESARASRPTQKTGDSGTSPLSLDENGSAPSQATPRPSYRRVDLNGRYRFENFIVGSSNNLAHAAAVAVSENPGFVYNPLVIYSGVGLGKRT